MGSKRALDVACSQPAKPAPSDPDTSFDVGSLKSLLPQVAVFGFVGGSEFDNTLAAHVVASDGPAPDVSLFAQLDLAGPGGLHGLPVLDAPCLLDGILGDCGLI